MPDPAYVCVRNIPLEFRTADLRAFFSAFIEEGKFAIFHYRHRKEKHVKASCDDSAARNEPETHAATRSCCIVALDSSPLAEQLRRRYNGQRWMDNKGEYYADQCFITFLPSSPLEPLSVEPLSPAASQSTSAAAAGTCSMSPPLPLPCASACSEQASSASRYLSRKDKAALRKGKMDLAHRWARSTQPHHQLLNPHHVTNPIPVVKYKELRPPPMLPRGNVGTPLKLILQLISECKLSPRTLAVLAIELHPRTSRRFGQVALDYALLNGYDYDPQHDWDGQQHPCLPAAPLAAPAHVLTTDADKAAPAAQAAAPLSPPAAKDSQRDSSSAKRRWEREETRRRKRLNIEKAAAAAASSDSGSEDSEGAEEWERHAAFEDMEPAALHYDRVDRLECSREEYMYEENAEQVWEKGSSGLVFYTDASYWDGLKGDFLERTCDHWDLDTDFYYNKRGHRRGDIATRYGYQDTRIEHSRPKRPSADEFEHERAKRLFDRYTKGGFAGQLLAKLGWTEGSGIGKNRQGIPSPIQPRVNTDRSGIGYSKSTHTTGLNVKAYTALGRTRYQLSTALDVPDPPQELPAYLDDDHPAAPDPSLLKPRAHLHPSHSPSLGSFQLQQSSVRLLAP